MKTVFSHIEECIVQTLTFFALFSRPLTTFEVIQYFYIEEGKDSFVDYVHVHNDEIREGIAYILDKSKHIIKKGDYYYLKDIHYPIAVTDLLAHTKVLTEKTKKYILYASSTPFVDMIALGNTLALEAVETAKSDIDLFVITRENHIWISRLIMAMFFQILGVRRYGKKVAGRFCLSFFIDNSHLRFASIMLDDYDVYMHFWIASLIPLTGIRMYNSFIQANGDVIRDHFPLWQQTYQERLLLPEKHLSFQKMRESVWNILFFMKPLVRGIQKFKMKKMPVVQNEHSSIIVTDHILKFHNNDRREYFRQKWYENVNNILEK